MVIKDQDGKVVILVSKADILEYIFEKCGLEVGIEAKEIFKKAEDSFTQDDCEGCDVLREKENMIDTLETALYDTQGELSNLKNKYIKYLKDRHYFAAAKMLEQMEE